MTGYRGGSNRVTGLRQVARCVCMWGLGGHPTLRAQTRRSRRNTSAPAPIPCARLLHTCLHTPHAAGALVVSEFAFVHAEHNPLGALSWPYLLRGEPSCQVQAHTCTYETLAPCARSVHTLCSCWHMWSGRAQVCATCSSSLSRQHVSFIPQTRHPTCALGLPQKERALARLGIAAPAAVFGKANRFLPVDTGRKVIARAMPADVIAHCPSC